MTYNDFIREKREKLHYTTRELGKMVGVSGSYISMIENNKINKIPSEEVLEKLCVALKMDINEEEKFYDMVFYNILPKKVREKLDKLQEKLNSFEEKYALSNEFEDLSEDQKRKALKFIDEFLKD